MAWLRSDFAVVVVMLLASWMFASVAGILLDLAEDIALVVAMLASVLPICCRGTSVS